MLAVDPPDHTRYRRAVVRAFTPRAIDTLRTRIVEITHERAHAAWAGHPARFPAHPGDRLISRPGVIEDVTPAT